MWRHSPFRIQLTREERRALEARARKENSPYRHVIRASWSSRRRRDCPILSPHAWMTPCSY